MVRKAVVVLQLPILSAPVRLTGASTSCIWRGSTPTSHDRPANISSASVNLQAELISQKLIDRLGAVKAAEIRQITINPDDDNGTGLDAPILPLQSVALNLQP